MKTIRKLFAVATCLALSASAHANVYKLDFTFSNIHTYTGVDPSPVSSISGSISYNASAPTGALMTITGIDLTIAGHTYTVAEVGSRYNSAYPDGIFFGGLVSGIQTITTNTDDFAIQTFPGTNKFTFTTLALNAIYVGNNGILTVTDLTTAVPVSVPEPGSIALLLAGVMGLGLASRRKKI